MCGISRIVLWLALTFACFLPVSALPTSAPENRVWEILSIGYDAAVTGVEFLAWAADAALAGEDLAIGGELLGGGEILGGGELLGGEGLVGGSELAAEEGLAAEGTTGVRAAYEAEVRALEDQGLAARAAGQDAKTTAEQLVDARNALKVQYRALSPPDAVLQFEQRNLELYGNPVGPSAAQLNAAGKTWEQIIESAARPGGSDLGF